MGGSAVSATGRIKVLSEPLQPPKGTQYPEGSTLRVVERTKRAENDFYETPAWCIDAVINRLQEGAAPLFNEKTLVVDAGSGTGVIAARLAARFPEIEIIGVEKDANLIAAARARNLRAAEFTCADFGQWTPEIGSPDVVIMNPPYSQALQFVSHALKTVRRGGTVCALLRLNWLAGKGRREFHQRYPSDVYVLTKRPSFTGRGTDATDYAWFVWGPERGNRWWTLGQEDKARAARKTPKTQARNG